MTPDPSRTVLLLDSSSMVFASLLDGEGRVLFEGRAPAGGEDAPIRLVQRGLESTGLGWNAPTRLVVCAGPGSFTGLRVGIAFILGLAAPGGLPIHAFGSLEALLLCMPPEREGTAALPAKRGWFYALSSGAGDPRSTGPRLATAGDLAGECLVYPGEAPAELSGNFSVSIDCAKGYPHAAVAALALGRSATPGGVLRPRYVDAPPPSGPPPAPRAAGI